MYRTWLIAAVMMLAGCSANKAQAQDIRLDGEDQVVVPAAAFQCSKPELAGDGSAALDVPDAPPRVLRRADGRLMMIAAHHNNIPWYSRDGISFSRVGCGSVLPSKMNSNPAAFDDQAWLVGFYTLNGRDVFGLVHNEFHGPAYFPACKARLRPGQAYWDPICLQISMKGYISHDEGSSFAALAADKPVLASANAKLQASQLGSLTRIGIHDPSNIVRNPQDGYAYFISLVDPSPGQPRGTCLFRSKDPLTQPWYAWDGSGFHAKMGSPYMGQGASCAPVQPWGTYMPALTYNTVLKKFIAIGRTDAHQLVALTSPDLIRWSPPSVLRKSVQTNWWKPMSGDPDPDSYWSIIDPGSTSPFFDTSGAHPYLYYVHWNTRGTRIMSHERDISRVRLSVQPIG